MSITLRTESSDRRKSVLESITDERRRRILDVLLEASSPLPLDALAERLADVEDGVTDEADVVDHRIGLVHEHLPALEAADLLEWDREEGSVITTDHPLLSDPEFRQYIAEGGADFVDVIDSLADERRATVLTVLEGRSGPTPRWALAREVAEREATDEPSREDVDEALTALHHVHLPKLDDAGFVEYDRDEETVTYLGHPELER